MNRFDLPTEKPTVTVGMPVCNGARYIRDALDSVLAQTYTDFELIISDNASIDETQDICNTYARRDSRIKYIRHAENRGAFENFNFVAQEAKGLFFTWIPYDDILETNFIKEAVEYMSTHPGIVLLSGDFKIIDERVGETVVAELVKIRDNIAWSERSVEFFDNPTSILGFCIYGMMRTDICKSIMRSMPAPKLSTSKELELPFLARFAVVGEIASVSAVWRAYRFHEANFGGIEHRELRNRSVIAWYAIRILIAYRVRLDIMSVLLRSETPLKFKINIATKVSYLCFDRFISKIKKVPAKIRRDFRFVFE